MSSFFLPNEQWTLLSSGRHISGANPITKRQKSNTSHCIMHIRRVSLLCITLFIVFAHGINICINTPNPRYGCFPFELEISNALSFPLFFGMFIHICLASGNFTTSKVTEQLLLLLCILPCSFKRPRSNRVQRRLCGTDSWSMRYKLNCRNTNSISTSFI